MINRNANGQVSVGAPGSSARLRSARTHGPLSYAAHEDQLLFEIHNDDGCYVAESNFHFNKVEQAGYRERAAADTKHLVACWNACEGYVPEHIPAFLEAARKIVRSSVTDAEWRELSVLLAKVEGRL